MQVVILAAGKSSRFYPYTDLPHKSAVSIAGKTIIEHTLLSVKESGIEDVLIIISRDSAIPDIVGDGKSLGLNITYVIQQEPLGGGNGLLSARDKIKDNFFLAHPYRVDFVDYKEKLLQKQKEIEGSVLLVKKDDNQSKFGFVKIENDRVVDLVEKPEKQNGHSGFRVVGIYLFDKSFLEVLDKTPQGHYQLEEAISTVAKGKTLAFVEADQEVPTLKYSWDLLTLKDLLLKKMAPVISPKAQIAKNATIEGAVTIEDGARIMEGACIKGPCYIGRNAYIGTNSLIREGTDVEENVKIGAYTELKNVLFGSGSSIHTGFIGDSVIGQNCKIAAYFCSANVRFDRENVKVALPAGEKIDSDLRSLGVLVGNGANIGIRVSTMPGVLIGKNAVIGPSSVVMKSVPQDSRYFTKFEVVQE